MAENRVTSLMCSKLSDSSLEPLSSSGKQQREGKTFYFSLFLSSAVQRSLCGLSLTPSLSFYWLFRCSFISFPSLLLSAGSLGDRRRPTLYLLPPSLARPLLISFSLSAASEPNKPRPLTSTTTSNLLLLMLFLNLGACHLKVNLEWEHTWLVFVAGWSR